MDRNGLERIVHEVGATSHSVPGCKFLVDLEEASLRVESREVQVLVHGLRTALARHDIKIALMSSAGLSRAEGLGTLRDSLDSLGLKSALFDDAKGAVVWLSEKT